MILQSGLGPWGARCSSQCAKGHRPKIPHRRCGTGPDRYLGEIAPPVIQGGPWSGCCSWISTSTNGACANHDFIERMPKLTLLYHRWERKKESRNWTNMGIPIYTIMSNHHVWMLKPCKTLSRTASSTSSTWNRAAWAWPCPRCLAIKQFAMEIGWTWSTWPIYIYLLRETSWFTDLSNFNTGIFQVATLNHQRVIEMRKWWFTVIQTVLFQPKSFVLQ